jgi:hypothetical protein
MGSGRAIPQTPFAGYAAMPDAGAPVSVLKTLKKKITIGSTVDPANHDVNPYGLAMYKNALYVCNFNNSKNVQGTGTTIVTLAAKPGAKPARLAQSASLLGCSALALNGEPVQSAPTMLFSTAALAKLVTTVCLVKAVCGGVGTISKTLKGKNVVRPWSAAWAVSGGPYTYATRALYVSDATTGDVILAAYCLGGQGTCSYPMTPIIKGFAVNRGKPGSIYGPSGLTFVQNNCVKIGGANSCGTLYVVDGKTNTVVAIHNVMQIRGANSIVVSKNGKTFGGPKGSWASLVYAGAPLNGPISAAALYNGNLVIGNTGEPAGTNHLVEIAPPSCKAIPCGLGTYLYEVNVDKGAAGALFGIVAAGTGTKTVVYFNDDNANNVQALER